MTRKELIAQADRDFDKLLHLRAEAEANGYPKCYCGKTVHLIYCGTCGKALYTTAHDLPIGCAKHE